MIIFCLLALGVLCLVGIMSLVAFWAGKGVGSRCDCCDFEMDCRFCVAAKCPKAMARLDPFSDPVHRP